MKKCQEKISYGPTIQTQAEALEQAKTRVKHIVKTDEYDLSEGLFLVHAPQEKAYYIENEVPMTRPGKGEAIIWSMN